MTKKYRYLGYGTTNSQGIAKLDHDKDGNTLIHSYTGVGAGELDLIASTDNPTNISSDSFQSPTFPLDDTFTYDPATSNKHQDIWDEIRCTLTRTTEYSEVVETTEPGALQTKTTLNIPKNCVIEFDYYRVDGATNSSMVVLSNVNSSYITSFALSNINLSIGAWHHIRIEYNNGYLRVSNTTNSNVFQPSTQYSASGNYILFAFSAYLDATTYRFRNFKVYPI